MCECSANGNIMTFSLTLSFSPSSFSLPLGFYARISAQSVYRFSVRYDSIVYEHSNGRGQIENSGKCYACSRFIFDQNITQNVCQTCPSSHIHNVIIIKLKISDDGDTELSSHIFNVHVVASSYVSRRGNTVSSLSRSYAR